MKDFEIIITLPAEARFADVLRALAAHAALYAGCPPADADTFAGEVEEAMHGCLVSVMPGTVFPTAVRCMAGEVEVLITCGRTVRIARLVPADG